MTIGVVIPAYQVERWLERCLRSVLEQTPRPNEVIVVDDGSTDTTPEIASRTPGVKLLSQENKGLAGARNAGTRASRADWILFLDADDSLLPGAMAAFQEAIAANLRAAVIDPAYESEYPDGRVVRPPVQRERLYDRDQLGAVIKRNPFGANALIKKDVATRYPYDETLPSLEDLDLWFRLLLDGHRIVLMGTATTRRLIGRSGALSNRILTMRESRMTVFRRLWRDQRLSAGERALLLYQFARVSAGIATARVLTRTAG